MGRGPKGRAPESVLCRWRSARADYHSLDSDVCSLRSRGGRRTAARSRAHLSGGTGRGSGKHFRRKRTGLEVNIFGILGFLLGGSDSTATGCGRIVPPPLRDLQGCDARPGCAAQTGRVRGVTHKNRVSC
jgi:hypothetical protein